MGPGHWRAASRVATSRRRSEAGSSSYELVLLMPVLVLMVLFVLWAGRTGQARLSADLAAEEAATAAAVCCTPDEVEKREAVVNAVLNGRPELDFLCINGARPLDGAERFVSQAAFHFDGSGGSSTGVGVLGLGFGCLTDGAVGVLGGILPETEIRARASAVVLLEPRPADDLILLPELNVDDVRVNEAFGAMTFRLELDRAAREDSPVSVWWRTGPYDTSPDPVGNATWATREENFNRFDFCADEIDREGQTLDLTDPGEYDPGDYATRHRDYLQAATGRVLIEPGETSETVRIDINDDCLYESEERLKVELFDENANVALIDREAVGVIISDDEPPFLDFLDTGRVLSEALLNPSDLFREVQLDPVLRNEFDQRIVSGRVVSGTVVTADGTATALSQGTLCPPDYVALPSEGQDGSFVIPELRSGPAPSLIVQTLDDAVYEGTETFTVRIDSAIGAQVGSPLALLGSPGAVSRTTMTITITDDDPLPFLHLIEPDDGSADRVIELRENEILPALGVLLSDADANEVGSGLDVVFTYDGVAGTAAADDDFTVPASLPPDGFTISACESASDLGAPVTVDVINDDEAEPPEQFTVSLQPLGTDIDVAEDDASVAADRTITVRILDDDVERIAPDAGDDGVINRFDCVDPNDPHQTPPRLQFEHDSLEVAERSGARTHVAISVATPLCEEVSVSISFPDGPGVTATPAADYDACRDGLGDFFGFPSTDQLGRRGPGGGSEIRFGLFEVCIDDDDEGDETFVIEARWATDAPLHYQNQPPARATVTITDDRRRSCVNLTDSTQTPPAILVDDIEVAESDLRVVVPVRLSDLTCSEAIVRLNFVEGVAGDNATVGEFCGTSPGADIAQGLRKHDVVNADRPAYLTLIICHDEVLEPTETITISVGWWLNIYQGHPVLDHLARIPPTRATITILDDDSACIDGTDPTLEAPAITVHAATLGEEDGRVSVAASLGGTLCDPVDVVLTPNSGAAPGGAVVSGADTCGPGDDVLGAPVTVPINGGRPVRLRLTVCDDAAVEGSETFTVSAAWAPGAPGHFPRAAVSADVTITDDDT